jgi:excisionase family DNA binding protein
VTISERRGAGYVTPKELAHELGVSTSAVYRSVERGELPAIRLLPRGSIHIPRSAIEHEHKVQT